MDTGERTTDRETGGMQAPGPTVSDHHLSSSRPDFRMVDIPGAALKAAPRGGDVAGQAA